VAGISAEPILGPPLVDEDREDWAIAEGVLRENRRRSWPLGGSCGEPAALLIAGWLVYSG